MQALRGERGRAAASERTSGEAWNERRTTDQRFRVRVKAEQSCGSAVEATNRSRAQQLGEGNRSRSGLSDKTATDGSRCSRLTSRRSPVRAGHRPSFCGSSPPRDVANTPQVLLVARCDSGRPAGTALPLDPGEGRQDPREVLCSRGAIGPRGRAGRLLLPGAWLDQPGLVPTLPSDHASRAATPPVHEGGRAPAGVRALS